MGIKSGDRLVDLDDMKAARLARVQKLGVIVAVLGFVMAASQLTGASAAGASPSVEGSFFSTEVYTTSTRCSNTAALRNAADLLDDEWRARARADSYVLGTIPGPNDPTPNPTTITLGSVSVDVSKYDVDTATAISIAASSWGTPDAVGSNDPETATSATLQDCAPRPASLYASSAAARPPIWNATAGDGSTLDAVMFEFSEPVAGFGAWFGDIETRVDEGQPARLKLFDSAGNVIANDWIPSDRPTPLPGDPSGRSECGGTQSSDALACGNQATQFIGFTYTKPTVARMLLIVGDDDGCLEFPAGCDGHAEHVSFVGPQLAVYETGELVVNKSEEGGSAVQPWQFEVSSENGCVLPENPYTRTAPAGGGTATFADLPVTLDGSTACAYTVSETPATGWAIATDQSDPLSGITVSPLGPTTVTVVNRFTPPSTTTTSTSTTTSSTTTSTSTTSTSTTTSSTTTSTSTTSTSTTTSSTTTSTSTTTEPPSTTTSTTSEPTTTTSETGTTSATVEPASAEPATTTQPSTTSEPPTTSTEAPTTSSPAERASGEAAAAEPSTTTPTTSGTEATAVTAASPETVSPVSFSPTSVPSATAPQLAFTGASTNVVLVAGIVMAAGGGLLTFTASSAARREEGRSRGADRS